MVAPYKPIPDAEWREMSEQQRLEIAETRPWDLLDPRAPRAPKVIAEGRMAICRECPQYQPLLKRCASCGCVMPLKTLLANSSCPENRWMPVEGVPK